MEHSALKAEFDNLLGFGCWLRFLHIRLRIQQSCSVSAQMEHQRLEAERNRLQTLKVHETSSSLGFVFLWDQLFPHWWRQASEISSLTAALDSERAQLDSVRREAGVDVANGYRAKLFTPIRGYSLGRRSTNSMIINRFIVGNYSSSQLVMK